MIIAAYAGTGKTYFSKQKYDAVDFVCMPYKYYLPDGLLSVEESESKKADLSLDMHKDWPENYIKAVINQYNESRYVIIPPIMPVLEALRNEDIPYILCYPERGAKEVYERRYRERGNTDNFLDVFIGHWDHFMDVMEKDSGEHHMVMKTDEYLTDLYSKFEEITNNEESVISFDVSGDLLKKANEIYRHTGYSTQALFRRELIRMVKMGDIPEYMRAEIKKY